MLKLSAIAGIRKLGENKTALLAALAALALAGQCAAAPGTSVANFTSTAPGGFIFDGTRLWVADASSGLCRMDPAGAGFNLTNCFKPSATAIIGQPAYDPTTRMVYLPDMSATSSGIWRYNFNGNTFTANTAFNVASGSGLGPQRPGAISIGSDGNLYASMTANANILRINTPSAATQTVDNMAVSISHNPAQGLAIVASQLWVADTGGILLLPDPVGCGAGCRGTINTQVRVTAPSAITWDRVSGVVYIGTPDGVFRSDPSTGITDFYSASFVKAGVAGLYSNVTGVGTDRSEERRVGKECRSR